MTVFVVQRQQRFNHEKQEMEDRFNSIHKAERFGRLEYLLSPQCTPFKTEIVVSQLQNNLRNYGLDDYLLLIGNPALIGMATTVAANMNQGRVKFLQWSGRDQDYTTIEARLF